MHFSEDHFQLDGKKISLQERNKKNYLPEFSDDTCACQRHAIPVWQKEDN